MEGKSSNDTHGVRHKIYFKHHQLHYCDQPLKALAIRVFQGYSYRNNSEKCCKQAWEMDILESFRDIPESFMDIHLSSHLAPFSPYSYSVFKRSISEFWRICCHFSMMKRFVCAEHRILLFSLSAETSNSSWRSYNISFKILGFSQNSQNTSSDNVWWCHMFPNIQKKC